MGLRSRDGVLCAFCVAELEEGVTEDGMVVAACEVYNAERGLAWTTSEILWAGAGWYVVVWRR